MNDTAEAASTSVRVMEDVASVDKVVCSFNIFNFLLKVTDIAIIKKEIVRFLIALCCPLLSKK